MFIRYDKKGVSEIVSYLLLTLLIVIISSATYFFAQNYLEEFQQEEDAKMMPTHLKKIAYTIDEIKAFDNQQDTYFISFNTGQIETNGSSLQYVSLVPFNDESVCLRTICYDSRKGYEVSSITLSNNYEFAQNISLTPGEYFIQFSHNKEDKEIDITLK